MTPDGPVTLSDAQEPRQNANAPGAQTAAPAAVCEPEDRTGTELVTPQPDSLAAHPATHAESAALYASSPLPQDMPVPFFHSSSRNHTAPPVEPLQIIVNSDRLLCRGVAGNLEPALLSGHVVLSLSEAANIKDISLEFVGKARIPNDSRSPQSSSIHPIIFSHRWSFLPDGARHMHTIKEGRHVFPFQLELDAALPASMTCSHVSSGADVYYKLRATAVRPTFSSNFHAVKPLFIIKAFSPESIEFTQSLEVENTWPGKVMYSIMIPHKAYAVGDAIPALLRFTPTAKGVSVSSIALELQESAIVRWRYRSDMHSVRTLCSAKYDIKQGKAVKISPSGSNPTDATGEPSSGPAMGGTGNASAASQSAEGKSSRSTSFKNLMNLVSHQGGSSSSSAHGYGGRGGNHRHGRIAADLSLSPTSSPPVSRTASSSALHTPSNGVTGTAVNGSGSMFLLHDSPLETPSSSRRPSQEDVRNPRPSNAAVGSTTDDGRGSASNVAFDVAGERHLQHQPRSSTNIDVDIPASGDEELTTKVYLRIPSSATPSHSPSVSTSSAYSSHDVRYPLPLTVSHKVRFSILLSNLDGHTSELRCALPAHILDGYLLREARAATRITREILLGRRRRGRDRRRMASIPAEQLGDAATPGTSFLDRPRDPSDTADDAANIEDDEEDWDDENDDDDDDDVPIELPSYNSHVRDPVANAEVDYGNAPNVYLPTSSAGTPGLASSADTSPHRPSPSRGGSACGQQQQQRQPLGFDEELMRSLGAVAAEVRASSQVSSPVAAAPPQPSSSFSWLPSSNARHSGGSGGSRSGFWSPSGDGSRSQSRVNSRVNSRAPSPEPRGSSGGGDEAHIPETASLPHSIGSGLSSGGMRSSGIFQLPSSLKPLSSLNMSALRPGSLSSRSNSGLPPLTTSFSSSSSSSAVSPNTSNASLPARRAHSRPPSPTTQLPPQQHHHYPQSRNPLNMGGADALNRVPSYDMSSRGFLGGGAPPLQLYRDLPTYEQVESTRNGGGVHWGTSNNVSTASAAVSPAASGMARSSGRSDDAVPVAIMTRSQSEMNLSSFRNRRHA